MTQIWIWAMVGVKNLAEHASTHDNKTCHAMQGYGYGHGGGGRSKQPSM